MPKKKYIPGRQIRTIEQLMKQEIVYIKLWNRSQHIGFILSMQLRTVYSWVKAGQIFEAKLIGEKANE